VRQLLDRPDLDHAKAHHAGAACLGHAPSIDIALAAWML
jgi:hypothetical protein